MADSESMAGAQEPEFVSSKVELARRLGIDRTTLYTHWKDPGRPPQETDGRFRVAAFAAWGQQNCFVAAMEDDDFDFSPAAMNRLKIKQLQITNALRTYQLDSLKKNYVSIEEHQDELKAVIDAARSVIDDLPQQISLLTTDRAIVDRVKAVCDRAGTAFHRKFEEAKKKAGGE
jgi:hypothetical protein